MVRSYLQTVPADSSKFSCWLVSVEVVSRFYYFRGEALLPVPGSRRHHRFATSILLPIIVVCCDANRVNRSNKGGTYRVPALEHTERNA
jgi:hypothetical protein